METRNPSGGMGAERHPPELPRLFMTEMWERFSFYLMLGLLPLYMIADPSAGGLGFDETKSGLIIGTYMGLVYFTPFIGGLLADRIIGYRNAVIIGAIIMCAGHVSLAFESMSMFYLGLGLLIIGNGFFKPNISTMLGRLYPEGSELKDDGFNIFYIGINLGAFICNFIAALVRNQWGWHAAFGTAGIGLAIGLVIFLTMYKRLKRAEIRHEERQSKVEDEGLRTLWSKVLPASLVTGTIGYLLGGENGVTWAFFAASIPVLVFYYRIWTTAEKKEKGPIGALLTISLVLIPFWMVFNLNSTVLSFWAERNTNREIASSITPALKEVNLLQDAPTDYFNNASPATPRPAKSWLKVIEVSGIEKKDQEAKISAAKENYAKILEKKGYSTAGPIPVTDEEYTAIYKHSDGQTLKPGESLPVANAELFQSVNPFWVMVLTPLLIAIWKRLRNRKKEPSTPRKMSLGMIAASGCWLIMLAAVFYTNDGTEKASALWLIGAYGVITIGELCLSPVGLSLVTKLAPARLGAVMMGGFFLSIALGNKLSGMVGGPVWKAVPHSYFFIGLTILMVAFAVIIWKISPSLEKYMPKPSPNPKE